MTLRNGSHTGGASAIETRHLRLKGGFGTSGRSDGPKLIRPPVDTLLQKAAATAEITVEVKAFEGRRVSMSVVGRADRPPFARGIHDRLVGNVEKFFARLLGQAVASPGQYAVSNTSGERDT